MGYGLYYVYDPAEEIYFDFGLIEKKVTSNEYHAHLIFSLYDKSPI